MDEQNRWAEAYARAYYLGGYASDHYRAMPADDPGEHVTEGD